MKNLAIHRVGKEGKVIQLKLDIYCQLFMIIIMMMRKIIVACCLGRNRALASQKNPIPLEDDGYASLRLGIIELKLHHVIRRHRSLPSISTIQHSISLGSQCVERCLSESNIPL